MKKKSLKPCRNDLEVNQKMSLESANDIHGVITNILVKWSFWFGNLVQNYVLNLKTTKSKTFNDTSQRFMILKEEIWTGSVVKSFLQILYGLTPDPPENCHLNVKKLPKSWHFFQNNAKKL